MTKSKWQVGRYMLKELSVGGLLFIVATFFFNATAEAQVKYRWQLGFTNDRPTLFVYRDPLDNRESYWYITFEITNNSPEAAPILLDLTIYTEYGRDFQSDKEKATLGKGHSGLYHPNIIYPEVEYKIIEKDAKLGNRPEGLVKDAIEKHKKDNKYLNIKELRERRFIKPGETIHSVAIFKDVDPRSRMFELQVAGLVDPLKITDVSVPEDVKTTDIKTEYESKILHILYEYIGDEFDREGDIVVFSKKYWMKKRIGPITSKDTLDMMMNIFLNGLKEDKSAIENKDIQRKITQLDLSISNTILKMATGKDFGYDVSKTALENEKAIWRWHEWWVRNKNLLYFDEKLNRFEIIQQEQPNK